MQYTISEGMKVRYRHNFLRKSITTINDLRSKNFFSYSSITGTSTVASIGGGGGGGGPPQVSPFWDDTIL